MYTFYTILGGKSYTNIGPLNIEWMDIRGDRKSERIKKNSQKYIQP